MILPRKDALNEEMEMIAKDERKRARNKKRKVHAHKSSPWVHFVSGGLPSLGKR